MHRCRRTAVSPAIVTANHSTGKRMKP
ncbi:TetR/AcrR family transcriptional regulator, partial [Enterobacter cloacae complex sp. 4DZ1-17B1]